jgi:hypothetical protein
MRGESFGLTVIQFPFLCNRILLWPQACFQVVIELETTYDEPTSSIYEARLQNHIDLDEVNLPLNSLTKESILEQFFCLGTGFMIMVNEVSRR